MQFSDDEWVKIGTVTVFLVLFHTIKICIFTHYFAEKINLKD